MRNRVLNCKEFEEFRYKPVPKRKAKDSLLTKLTRIIDIAYFNTSLQSSLGDSHLLETQQTSKELNKKRFNLIIGWI